MTIALSTCLNLISSIRSDAESVMHALHDGLYFANDSIVHHTSFMRQRILLEKVQKILRTKSELVINELESTLKSLVQQENILLNVATDSHRIRGSEAFQKIRQLFQHTDINEKKKLRKPFLVKPDYKYRMDRIDNLPKHVAVGIIDSNSCELIQTVLYNSTDFHHKKVSRNFEMFFPQSFID